MAQTTQISPKLKAIYKKIFGKTNLNTFVRSSFESSVSTFANAKGFYFPSKFNWEWKLEMLLGKYEHETTVFFKKNIKQGMTIVDIGAHIGYFSRLFANKVGKHGKVFAFEADPDNFKLLTQNTSKFKNITLLNKAISKDNGTIDFYHIENSTGCHSLISPNESSRKISVPATTLDNFLKSNSVDKVDMIKMDIEGAEPFALIGMRDTLSQKSIMLISEFNPEAIEQGQNNPIEYLKTIESFGFSIFAITEAKLIKVDAGSLMSHVAEFHKVGYINILCKK